MHQVRPASKGDLDQILKLGKQMGHQMMYQKDSEVMERCLPRIIVTEVSEPGGPSEDCPLVSTVTGYYHYIVSGDPGFIEMLQCWRQMPKILLLRATEVERGELCVVMQGGCHRDDFKLLIQYLQREYSLLWCWNSVTDPTKPSGKIEGYKELGFIYDTEYIYSFFNVNKGGMSTYQLGYWAE